jgi:hypothetical protein
VTRTSPEVSGSVSTALNNPHRRSPEFRVGGISFFLILAGRQ